MLLAPLLFSLIFNPAHAENTIKFDMPPASLQEWYKPNNKRQVWLHTMFRLRREMQAINEYAKENNIPAMKKWIKRLEKDYNKIADMVPEWEKEIKPRLLPELKMFANKGDTLRVTRTLEMITETCNDCHQRYQPFVTAIYRSPGYDDIKLKNKNGTPYSFKDNMQALTKSLNQILIALDDGKKSTALQARQNLSIQLQELGNSCKLCHKKDSYPKERILGKAMLKNLALLETRINKDRVKGSQKLLGKIGVTVCARCHNIHRIVSDLRSTLSEH